MTHRKPACTGAGLPLREISPNSRPAGSVPPHAEQRWHPEPGLGWQWQLSGRIDTSFDVDVYGVDAVETPDATVDKLHKDGSKVVCYISAGSWENWRPDAGDFPEAVKGRPLDGWSGEKWLDVRQVETLRPIMQRRMDVCKKKGFDAVEPDNIDGYANESGFSLTPANQLTYNRMLAEEAHERGLAIALKNDTAQVGKLVDDFDFAIVEECFTYNECPEYSPFVEAGKAVFVAEYDTRKAAAKCEKADRLDFGLIFKRLKLDAWRRGC
ncbi:MAG: endo alpha-1,4 polygalactosaminidase [Rubrobacteraceae bacterium]|nr:endo alpha-1,4 polygalactosaminidase [Rubrobacteraceae bacterium]